MDTKLLSTKFDYEVVDVRPDMRHLLLLARRNWDKQKFLCGHDERHRVLMNTEREASGASHVVFLD